MKSLILWAFLCLSHQGACLDETIIIGMDNQLTFSGLNTTLECQIGVNTSNGPKLSYKPVDIVWYFKPVRGNVSYVVLKAGLNQSRALNNDISGASSGDIKYSREVWIHMTVIEAGFQDAGTYSCALADDPSQNASAQLYVIEDVPKCTIPHEDIFYEGDNVTLGCSIKYHGNQQPRMDWHLPTFHIDRKNVTFTNDVTEYNGSYNLHNYNIQFPLQRMVDGKSFYCTAAFPNITKNYSCDHVKFPPGSVQFLPYITHITSIPKRDPHNIWAQLGSNMTLFCFGHGNPTVTFTWEFIPVNGTKKYIACDQEVCRLTNLGRNNTGKYICTVMNTIKGNLRTANFSLDIRVLNVNLCQPDPCIHGACVNGSCRCTTGYRFNGKSCEARYDADGTTLYPEVVEYKAAGMSPYAIGAVICASLAVILIVVFIFLAMKMRSRERRLHQRLTRMHDENLDDQEVELLDENIQPDTSELPAEYGRLKQQWEIARKDIRLVDLIANGSFVEVWKGRMRKYPRRNEIMKVAIKRVNAEASEKEKKFFLAELEVMKAIQPQQNILPLIGCYTASGLCLVMVEYAEEGSLYQYEQHHRPALCSGLQNEPWLVMVEYAVEGSLYQYLQHHRPGDLRVEINAQHSDSVSLRNQSLTANKLLTMATQIVNGLQYINRFKMIYYRLRASSVLVCKNGICKLSGFGFVPDITERNLYESNSAPVRWMSPESLLDNTYNVKTDIWQFGIVLWEIVHFGHLPYPDMGPHEVSEKIHTGYRMPQPPHCSGDIYNLMLMCWAQGPENRPSFGDIMQTLTHLAQHASSHVNIDRLPEGLKSSDIVENSNALA